MALPQPTLDALSVVGSATIGYVPILTVGSGSQNVLTVTPGANTSSPVVFSFTVGNSGGAQINPGSGGLKIGSTGTGVVTMGGLVLGQNNNYSSSGTTFNRAINVLANPTGSFNASGGFGGFYSLSIGGDAMAATNTQGISGLKVGLGSGTGISGTRYAIHGDLNIAHVDSLSAAPAHVVSLFTGALSVSYGGTSPNSGSSRGSFFGINPNIVLASGATNLSGLIGQETNLAIRSGASAQEKVGLQIVKTTLDRVAAGDLETDVAIRVLDQGDTSIPAWQNIYDIGGWLAQWPASTTSTLIRARPTNGSALGAKGYQVKRPFADTGLDFYRVSFTSYSARLPGLSVNPAGNLSANALKISTSGATTSLDAVLQTSSLSSIASGGTNYYAGDIVNTDDGTIFSVATVGTSPGAITGLTLLVAGYSSSPPTNPVALRNGSGASATVNLTWTAQTTLSINPGGATVRLGSGAWSANGTVATAMSSLGPTGSHTTIQEWFVVKNASGTVRYIPAY